MRLVHHSPRELEMDWDRTYEQVEAFKSPYDKPRGFWLSDEDDLGWAEWCRTNEFPLPLGWATEFELVRPDRILHIATAAELDEFTSERGIRTQYGTAIDWDRLTYVYAGILITPYLWSRRLERHTTWYYSWDVASACIWDLSVLRIKKPESEERTEYPIIPGGYTQTSS